MARGIVLDKDDECWSYIRVVSNFSSINNHWFSSNYSYWSLVIISLKLNMSNIYMLYKMPLAAILIIKMAQMMLFYLQKENNIAYQSWKDHDCDSYICIKGIQWVKCNIMSLLCKSQYNAWVPVKLISCIIIQGFRYFNVISVTHCTTVNI